MSRSTLNSQLSTDLASHRLQLMPAAVGKPKKKKQLTVTVGSVGIRIYKTRWRDKKREKAYTSYTIAWRQADGRRAREKRNTIEAAEARAQEIGTSICNGQTAMLEFTAADRASYQRALDLLRPIGKPLELVAAEYAELMNILGNRASPAEVARYYIAQHPAGGVPRNAPSIVAEFFEKRDLGAKWKRVLKTMLDRFSSHFTGPLPQIQSRDLDDWLDGLKDKQGKNKLGRRSRQNYRNALAALFQFARERGDVAKDWDVLKNVSKRKVPSIDVNLYTPDELVTLLNKAESTKAGKKLVPFIVITAFAGVRHGEMNEEKARLLDWSDIDFESKGIYVGKATAKTGNDRVVDMPDNLIAWLQPYARKTGKICDLSNTSNALCRLRKKAGIHGSKKNALRKSFISYKSALTRNIELVADQAGNSAGIIRKNYKRIDTRMKEAATRWFSIMPVRADILPLFAWGKQATA